jgi:RimJ/RimL family protein N-acetyltransferase
MRNDVHLRSVREDDLAIFFEQQLDPEANHMAAFTSRDPTDRDAFMAHWNKILGDGTATMRTIVFDGEVAGNVLLYQEEGRTEVGYWIGKDYWGKGIATRALSEFLGQIPIRPLHARAAKDNIASLRVLEKCGFAVVGEDSGFAKARGQEVEESLLELRA